MVHFDEENRRLYCAINFDGHIVFVYETMMGATCCREDWPPSISDCPYCGSHLRNQAVYQIVMTGQPSVAVLRRNFATLSGADLSRVLESLAFQYLEALYRRGLERPVIGLPALPGDKSGATAAEPPEDLDDLIEKIGRSGWLDIAMEIHVQLEDQK